MGQSSHPCSLGDVTTIIQKPLDPGLHRHIFSSLDLNCMPAGWIVMDSSLIYLSRRGSGNFL